MRGTVEERYAG